FLLVVNGQREEVDAFLRLLRGYDGGQHGGLAVGGEHGSSAQPRHLAGFERKRASAPVELNTVFVEHCDCLSWFSWEAESHEQDGEKLFAIASGDPAMAFEPSIG